MNSKMLSFIVPAVLMVQACGTTAIRNDPDKIVDTGKKNTVVLSYDLTLQALERHPQATVASASLCHDAKTNKGYLSGFTSASRCFKMPIGFKGTMASSKGIELQTYSNNAVDVHQLKYGKYVYDTIKFRVLVDKEPEMVCTEQRVSKKSEVTKTVCKTEYNNIYRTYTADLPEPIEMNVASGNGCFLGHIALRMKGNELTDYKINPATQALDYSLVSQPIREKVQSHVTQPCLS